MPVRLAVLNAQQSAACALTRPHATAHLPNSFARYARRFATGAQRSVVHTTWITASAAPRLASSAPQRAARWPLDPAAGKGGQAQFGAACGAGPVDERGRARFMRPWAGACRCHGHSPWGCSVAPARRAGHHRARVQPGFRRRLDRQRRLACDCAVFRGRRRLPVVGDQRLSA